MTQVKLTRNAGGNKAGDTIEVTTGAADQLVANGYAEAVEVKAKSTRPKSKASTEETDAAGGAGASPTDTPSTAG